MIKACIPVIPSFDLEKSLHFWVEGLGFTVDSKMIDKGKLKGCMIHCQEVFLWLNERAGSLTKADNYEGIRLYWTPTDINATRERLKELGYDVSDIEDRNYGQTEFFVTDDDGYSHCFGVASDKWVK
ncbi:MAG TPA: VOC family protein [Saprospiraceae bacterium]|nr:VOC family protein [Saprospiraceae bacterium]MCB9271945.1 VOC family protein [Lewinellaceae bacterium]HPG07643.1 VOC family protein [Saprospiraceae bacterium]HRV84911.1 VOC family protein [Saprospiraceae bacterium]